MVTINSNLNETVVAGTLSFIPKEMYTDDFYSFKLDFPQ